MGVIFSICSDILHLDLVGLSLQPLYLDLFLANHL